MNCPFCKGLMEKGFLQCGNMLVWTKKKRRLILSPGEGEIILDQNYMTYCALPAWVCRSCRKIITEYNETNTQ